MKLKNVTAPISTEREGGGHEDLSPGSYMHKTYVTYFLKYKLGHVPDRLRLENVNNEYLQVFTLPLLTYGAKYPKLR